VMPDPEQPEESADAGASAPDGIDLSDPMDLRMGDVVRLRKKHPCGGFDWEIVRLGGDIGLRCLLCQRRIILERPVLRRRIRQFVSRGEALSPEMERALYGGAGAAAEEDASIGGDDARNAQT